jgi:hypothetical protein
MDNIINSSGVEQDNHATHGHSYQHENWVDMNTYSHMAMPGYGGGDYYLPPTTHNLPSETIGDHMVPPSIQPIQSQPHHRSQHSHHYGAQPQHSPPAVIPTQTGHQLPWPSTRTNPGQGCPVPPMPIPASRSGPQLKQPKLPSMTPTQGRKTLTLEDRRAMCQFAEENPNVKQTEIGQRFGVERR